MAVTVIEWDRQRVIVAAGDSAGSKSALKSVHVISRQDDQVDDQTVIRQLNGIIPKSSGTSLPPVVLVFPRQSVTIHRLQLPRAPLHELPDMVRLQATMRLTVPVDSVCLDFAPLPTAPESSTSDVLLVTIPLDQINTARRILRGAGRELTEVRVSSFTVAASLSAAGFLQADSGRSVLDAVVLMRDDFIEVTFVSGQSVVYAHSGGSWTAPDGIERAVRSELNRARMAAVEALGEYRLGRLLLVGDAADTQAVSDQVVGRMTDVTVLRIDPRVSLLAGDIPATLPSACLVAVSGAVTTSRSATVEQVDLINPRRAPEVRDLRRAKVLGGILAALMLFAGGWTWRQNKIRALEKQTAEIEDRAAELRDAVKLGESDLNAASEISGWAARDLSCLDIMSQLQQQLPGTDRLIVKRFQFNVKDREGIAGTILIEARAKSAADVESLARRLVEAGYSVDPFTPTTSVRDPSFPTEITLQLTMPLKPVSAADSRNAEEKS